MASTRLPFTPSEIDTFLPRMHYTQLFAQLLAFMGQFWRNERKFLHEMRILLVCVFF